MSSSIARPASRNRWAALVLIVAHSSWSFSTLDRERCPRAIKSSLDFSQASLQWVITAYAITFGGFLLLGGRLADILGRRRDLHAGIAVFTLGSVLSGLAWSATSLVVFRGLQGAGRRALRARRPLAADDTFREGRERNVALGIWGAASGSGAAVGVLLGGVLTSYLTGPGSSTSTSRRSRSHRRWCPRLSPRAGGDLASRHFDVAGATDDHRGAHAPRLCADTGDAGRLGSPTTVSLLAASALLAPRSWSSSGGPNRPLLPFEVFRGNTLGDRERDHHDHRCDRVLAVLPVDALPAAGPALLRSGERARVHAIAGTVAVMSNVAQRFVTLFGSRRVLAAGLLFDGRVRGPARSGSRCTGTTCRPPAVVHPGRPRAWPSRSSR